MTQTLINITFYSLTIFFSIVQFSISLYALTLMIIRRQIFREHRIDYLLFANTYLAALMIAVFFLDMCAYSIYGHLHVDVSFDGWWCKIKGYLLYISGCTFFHTFALQGIYRFCRILHQTKIRLQSFRLYVILSGSLWIFTSLELLTSFLIGDIEYIINDYHCQFVPTSIRGSFTVYTIGFVIPFTITVCCYMWTMYNIRKQTAALSTIDQQASVQRDMVVMKRLMIFLTVLTTAAAPHVFLPVIYLITGALPEFVISLEWLITSIAIVCVLIILFFITPQLTKRRVGLPALDPIRTVSMPIRRI